MKVEDNLPVTIIWCDCGESVEVAIATNLATSETYKTISKYYKKGHKIETVPMHEYRTKPFMTCKCFN